ncbi:SRPBCC family protein [Bradyrhizobium sp. BR 10261]|uniref:SRPBCC family protein n=1 Tax=Bradyrhizobium sp. BR 10261 TaxID=2749992 RepID=UPI001C649D6B|nr:SRPBCC family protein [Bradyrhizobium sp. BR 10261]MBW7963498.1 SRPBCC family protein [Bradyrhizobium sp. BR 10261]
MTRIFCRPRLSMASVATFGTVLLYSGTASAAVATISRSVDVKAAARDVWSLIGPFCAIKDWLPPVGQCIEDGKAPSTRILVTKDGRAAFVETQVARNEAEYSYSYKFLTSPLPVSNYTATIKVTAKANGSSTITWNGSYTPEPGQEKAASEALLGVYEAGLAEIQARFAK